jgi:NAD(P)-dependent dehydrogenase (short-subunit alcohol dehydrogenase family)
LSCSIIKLKINFCLAGKRIFITGASSGIGKELALQYAEKGAK